MAHREEQKDILVHVQTVAMCMLHGTIAVMVILKFTINGQLMAVTTGVLT
jgi:hypothetical protein